MTNLVITNYDNFKDLSYFIDQHKKASKIMEEVNNFYLSFLKSKLVYNYDIDKFQGKVIIEKFKNRKEQHSIGSHHPKYNEYIKGAYLQDDEGYWFTVTKVEKEHKRYWSCNNEKEKYYYIEYDIDRPYYISLYDLSYVSKYNSSVEEEISECNDRIKRGYFNSKTEEKLKNLLKQRSEHEERYRLYKELDSLVNEENYKSQSNYKSKLVYYIQKYENPGYYIINPRSGNFEYFGNKETLNKYLFKISPDNKYLIVYTEKYDGGTRTDRWKTFEYKGRRYHEFWFDTNTGNFVENKDYLIKDWEVELDVHNGWHPFDDD